MSFLSLMILAAALASDAFSAAVTDGMIVRKIGLGDAIKISFFFGAFQFIMPCIGIFISGFAAKYVESFDHWIVFVLLAFLGIRMIMESFSAHEIPKDPLNIKSILIMAFATSVDALAAGVTLAAVGAPVIMSSGVIGIVAFIMSFAGVYIGKRFGCFLGNKAETAGGVILILIGIKTLIEHLFFS